MRTAKYLRILLTTLAASLTALAWAAPSHAGLIEIATFTGNGATLPTGGNTVSAAATFYVDSAAPNVLIIDLVNTSKFSDTHPGGGNLGGEDVLTGLVFDISGSPAYATAPSAQNLTPSLSLSGNGTTSTLIGSGSLTDTWTNDITPGGNPNVADGQLRDLDFRLQWCVQGTGPYRSRLRHSGAREQLRHHRRGHPSPGHGRPGIHPDLQGGDGPDFRLVQHDAIPLRDGRRSGPDRRRWTS